MSAHPAISGNIVQIEIQTKQFLLYYKSSKNFEILFLISGLRKNIILREMIRDFEKILKADEKLQEKLTIAFNKALGDSCTHLVGKDLIAFAEGYRINADKRRIKNETAEQELLALEELGLMGAK